MKKKLITRVLDRLYVMIIEPLKEKTFVSSEGSERLHYLFFRKKKSNVLMIVFQACNDNGARYNYVRTIKCINASRLYIKDDFAENHRGNYYLGCNGTYSVEKSVYELIDQCIRKCNAKELIFIGSSKGGYAAINFGIHYKFSKMIVAAPQYHIGTYLYSDKFLTNLKDILGNELNENLIRQLDRRLSEKIKMDTAGNTQTVYIHYSVQEHTYEEHVKDLIEDLDVQGIKIYKNVRNYSEHSDLKYYFPEYLRKCLEEIIGRKDIPR